MPRIPRHEFLGFPEGLMNRNMVRNSPPGEVITYTLSEEELLAAIEKYGPILKPLPRHRKMFGKKVQ